MKLSTFSSLVVVTLASQAMASGDFDGGDFERDSLNSAPIVQDVVVHDDFPISSEELNQMRMEAERDRAIIEESDWVVMKSKGSFVPPQEVAELLQQAEAQLEIYYSLMDLNEKEEYRSHLLETFNDLNKNPYICNAKESQLVSQRGTEQYTSEVNFCKKLGKQIEQISLVVQPLLKKKSSSRSLRRVDSMELMRRKNQLPLNDLTTAVVSMVDIKEEVDRTIMDAREAIELSRKARLEMQSSNQHVDLSEFLKSPAGQELPHLCEELKDLVNELPKLKDFDSVINACARACQLRDVLMSHPFVLNQSKGKEEAEGVDLSEQEAYVREEIARLLTATQIAMDMAERNLGNLLG